MKILALDTALNACSVAILDGDNVQAHVHEKRARGHAETLMPLIQDLMKSCGTQFSDLDLIAVTVGPGTFTGLRIGLAAARGIALAAAKPCRGITTLEALAASVPANVSQGRPIIATADARRREIYAQVFSDGQSAGLMAPQTEPIALPLVAADSFLTMDEALIIGSGGPLLAAHPDFDAKRFQISDLDPDPDAILVGRLAATRPIPRPSDGPPAPLYLRAPDAKLPGGKDPAPAGEPTDRS
ncbi:tRNA (adenosine(37)-N6)-threonylcarbamoyltransferase complex dimerization subunit type 1 TsaB [Sneathiella marina]|uniref:tRNA (Adenosine(37)-N6)-threonylcarbamoyltransferase complex dimerization subunit type 1 TsaB n=1 Tax=Sneathiella marina TaxID=2950108 RepID=A0ABY4W2B6_9PROT|nr:tRNA (adenosine(37)-N6)-threonylcarbamoyltransferase complex dimerization subunit type 1 TsaB [Sneathiella marina]USG61203.1 tRNA (adenosine(37)-N6)-threonylcarbamoyltransferase complex dimerization subunit type 1 TsaB [Sneathiella marina]